MNKIIWPVRALGSKPRRWALLCCLVGSLLACRDQEPTLADKKIFWNVLGDVGGLNQATIRNGQVPEVFEPQGLPTTISGVYGGAIDRKGQQVYFLSSDSVIRQLRFDLTDPTMAGVLRGESSGFGINAPYGTLSKMLFSDEKLYWSQIGGPSGSRIVRVNPDGSGFEVLYRSSQNSDTVSAHGLAKLDQSAFLYWGSDTKVWRGEADGKAIPQMIYDLSTDSTKGTLNDVALRGNQLFLATTKGLWVGKADGSAPLTRLFVAETTPAQVIRSVTIDPTEGQLYWFCRTPDSDPEKDFQFLYRGGADGSSAKKLLEREEGNLLGIY